MKADFGKFLSYEVKRYDSLRRESFEKRSERAKKLNPLYREIEAEKKKREKKRKFREKLVELA